MPGTVCMGNGVPDATVAPLNLQDSAVIVCKANRDSQNTENMIPLSSDCAQDCVRIGNRQHQQDKSVSKAITAVHFASGPMAAYGTIIRGRKGFSNGSSICNRKKQSHQQVINRLKALDFNIAPSGLDMTEDPLARAVGAAEAPSDSETAKKDFNCQPNNGVGGYNEPQCSIPTCERSERSKKKPSHETKTAKHRSEDLAVGDSSLQCAANGGPSAEKEQAFAKGMKEMLLKATEPSHTPPGGGFASEDIVHGYTHRAHSFIDALSQCSTNGAPPITRPAGAGGRTADSSAGPALSSSGSYASSQHGTRGNSHKSQHKGGTVRTHAATNGEHEPGARTGGNGTGGIVIPYGKSNKTGPQGTSSKQKESASRLDLFGGGPAVTSQNIRSTAHQQQHAHPQPAPSYLHHLSGAQTAAKHQAHPQQPMQPELHHAAMSKANGSHQYSFDFLVDVGLKMSYAGTGNGTGGGQSVGPMPCAASQMNYNFTQQFQQHMQQHHQQLQQQQDHSQSPSPSRSQSHPLMHQHHQQHHGQHLPQAMSQQQHHRSQPTAVYGGENLISPQNFVMNEAPAPFSNHIAMASTGELQMLSGANGNGGTSSNMIEPAPYVYTQHEGGDQQQHQHHPAMYYPQHHSQQQQQPHGQYLHNYHPNNNYQYHNRNGRGIPANYYGRDEGSRKKPWAGHAGAGKGKGGAPPSTGKQFNKVQNVGYSYRKNYHHYHNYPAGNGHQYQYEHSSVPPHHHHHHHQQQQQQQQQQQAQHHHHKQNMYRNLVYVRGYDQGHGAASPPEIGSHGAKEPAETAEEQHNVDRCVDTRATEEEVPNELEKEVRDGHEDGKLCSVPRSSSSSSVVSIPSTASSSAVSCRSAQAHLTLEAAAQAGPNGHDYESDSSHSSDYHDGTYRAYSNHDDRPTVYRSSSTTSSGISSSATYPPSNEFAPSTPRSMAHHGAGALEGDFFGRSHSYHGSHQNLSAYASGGSVGEVSPPVGSPTVSGTQSLPLFGELFGTAANHHHHHHHSQSVISFGSSSSLDQAATTLHTTVATGSSSSSSSLSASSVPPNDFSSMQSGQPKKRSHSGRASPTNGSVPLPRAASKENVPTNHAVRKNNQVSLSYTYRTSVPPPEIHHTPADRFILRADEVEMKAPPEPLTDGGPYDGLSQSVWDRFTAAQQTEHTYITKLRLWRYLYICIRTRFPKYGLYLVGSTISGFGANSSDVDMCLVVRSAPSHFDPRTEALYNLSAVKDYLVSEASPTFGQFSLIQAKVPILRFQDSKHGIEVDLNFNNCVGIRNTHLLHCYSQLDWRVRPLVLVVKLWAHHHNINDAKSMTISSYSLVLMVIHFLQCGVSVPVLPCLHSMYPDKFMKIIDINSIEMIERIEPYQTENRQTLGELLLQFLEYYTHFEYARYAISVRTASVIPIEECRLARSYKNDPHHWKHLCIEEPFDLTNTARSVFDGDVFEQIKSTFGTSWRMLEASKCLSALFGDPLFTPLTSTLSITS
ncbi:poly(A) RNA polymerase gld-2 homolog B [Anopheles cruzii]|uniref:poly(A) RNA polymerase gld-2 homolog B n=1 Tax=Anopheles cruzii TaxID=68878 RepID=UPI0022EC3147|nr:poly(A) RNA polymerase gld-2 homolog B [Anopheles cruzii]